MYAFCVYVHVRVCLCMCECMHVIQSSCLGISVGKSLCLEHSVVGCGLESYSYLGQLSVNVRLGWILHLEVRLRVPVHHESSMCRYIHVLTKKQPTDTLCLQQYNVLSSQEMAEDSQYSRNSLWSCTWCGLCTQPGKVHVWLYIALQVCFICVCLRLYPSIYCRSYHVLAVASKDVDIIHLVPSG